MQHPYHADTVGAMSVGARGVFNAAYVHCCSTLHPFHSPQKVESGKRSMRSHLHVKTSVRQPLSWSP